MWHLGVVMPLVTIATSGLVFKRSETFPSHQYALDLCEKYGIDLEKDGHIPETKPAS
jgi:hypothetical protein